LRGAPSGLPKSTVSGNVDGAPVGHVPVVCGFVSTVFAMRPECRDRPGGGIRPGRVDPFRAVSGRGWRERGGALFSVGPTRDQPDEREGRSKRRRECGV